MQKVDYQLLSEEKRAALKTLNGNRQVQRLRRPPHSGITLTALLELVESHALIHSPESDKLKLFICEQLFELVDVSLEEVNGALEQITFIQQHETSPLIKQRLAYMEAWLHQIKPGQSK